MAVGDAAGAAGLKTYSDSLLVTDIDVALNQRGDDIAADRARLTVLEKQTIGVPKFSVKRSSNGQNITAEKWTQLTAGAWASPLKNIGGFGWSGGVLTIPKAGTYQLGAHAMFRTNDYRTAAIQVTRNTTSLDTNASLMASETTVQSPDIGTNANLGITAYDLVPLNAGDLIRVFVLQRNRGAQTVNVGAYAMDLTFSALWIDS